MSESIDVEYKELPADVDEKSYDLGYAAGVESQKEHMKALAHRCYALTKGRLCFFCPLECIYREKPFRENENE